MPQDKADRLAQVDLEIQKQKLDWVDRNMPQLLKYRRKREIEFFRHGLVSKIPGAQQYSFWKQRRIKRVYR